jgi:hypothetical protein
MMAGRVALRPFVAVYRLFALVDLAWGNNIGVVPPHSTTEDAVTIAVHPHSKEVRP